MADHSPPPPSPPPPPPPNRSTFSSTSSPSSRAPAPPDPEVARGWFAPSGHDRLLTTTSPVRWGMGDALIGLALAQVAAAIGAIVVIAAVGGFEDASALDDLPMEWLAVMQAFLWLGYGGFPWLVSRKKGNGPVIDFGWRFHWSDMPQGLLIGVGTQLIAVPLLYLPIFWLIGEQDVSEPARDLVDRATGLGIVVLIFVVVVGAPVVEELFFRGLVLRSIQRRFGAWPAALVSSALFGVVHFQVVQFPALFLFGLLAAWLTLRSGRLGPAIWAHVGFNAVSILVLLTLS